MKQITLTLDNATVNSFSASGIKLLAWKSIGNSDLTAKPLIWSVFQTLFQTNYVSYDSPFSAYTAERPTITEGTVVLPNSEYPIDTNQTLAIIAKGVATVVSGGTAGAVTVTNSDNVSYLCGLSQAEGDQQAVAPYCAATIYPGFAETFYPVDKVLLAFSSADVAQGEYIAYLADSPASQPAAVTGRATAIFGLSMLLVDLSASDSRTVSYSIDQGWSNGVWAKQYASATSLSSILIQGDG